MNSQKCRCCNKITTPAITGRLLGENIQYFECNYCGYVQTEQPHWLEKAYSTAINDSDTGILVRNAANAKITIATLCVLKKQNELVVDYAGGYGVLVRHLRDYGIDAQWYDPYCTNLFAKGFEFNNANASLVTAFEAFEHFVYPCKEIDNILNVAPNILISTELIPTPIPEQGDWWYYGNEHGQHIGFYKIDTLKYIANKFNKYLISDGQRYHLLSQHPISSKKWNIMKKIALNAPWLFTRKLKSKTLLDHSNFSSK